MLRCFVFSLCALIASSAAAAEKHPGMDAFIAGLAKGDAARQSELGSLLDAAEYQPAIIAAMSKPAEATKAWYQYRPIFMTEERVAAGTAFYAQHRAELFAAQELYGVPAEYVVAIIGVETFYGRITGKWKVLDALTTLAFYYPPRAPFFLGELKGFIELPQTRSTTLDQRSALGSYAGAMGLGQFMPTSFIQWAVDADSDGTIDLWSPGPDLFHSVANYLKEHGWTPGGPVVAPMVPGPAARRIGDTGLDPVFALSQLVAWGYQPDESTAIAPDEASNLLSLEVAEGEFAYFAIFGNFRVITRYNRSPMYAMAVHELAQEIAARSTSDCTATPDGCPPQAAVAETPAQ